MISHSGSEKLGIIIWWYSVSLCPNTVQLESARDTHFSASITCSSTLHFKLYILHVGLQVFEFEYDFTSPRLIAWEARVLQLADIWTQNEPKTAPRDKRKDTNYTEMFWAQNV